MTVAGLGGPVAKLSVGGAHTCVVLEDGRAQCWGGYGSGQTGGGSFPLTSVPTPVFVAGLEGVLGLTRFSGHQP